MLLRSFDKSSSIYLWLFALDNLVNFVVYHPHQYPETCIGVWMCYYFEKDYDYPKLIKNQCIQSSSFNDILISFHLKL